MAEDLKISVGVELNMDSAEISQQLSTLSNQLKQKDGLKIGLEVDEAGSLASIQSAIKSIQSNLNNDPIKLAARLDTTKTLSGMRSDIKTIQNALSKTDLQFGSTGKAGKKSGFSGANSFLDNVAGVQRFKDQFERAYKEYTKAFNDPTMRVADVRMNFDVDSQTFTGLVKYQNALGKTTAMTFELADGWDNVRIKQASVSDDLKKQEREQTKVLTTLAKAQSNLETLQSKAFNQKNPLTGAFKDQAEQAIKEYQSVIDQFAKSTSLSDMDVSAINTAERTLKTRLDELRSAQYGASELRSKDVTSEVNRLGDALTVFENKAQSAGAMTQEFQAQVDQIRTALASVSDTQGLEQVRNQIDQLKASFDAYRTSVQGVANVRAAGIETGQLAQIQRLLSLDGIKSGSTSGIVALHKEIERLGIAYQSVITQLRNPDLSPDEYTQLTNELKQLDQQLTSVSNTAKIFDGSLKSDQTIKSRQQQIEKLKNSVKELQDNWSAYADDPDLRNAVDSFAASLNDADVVNIGQYQKAFTTLRSEIKAAGKDAESFGTQVKDAFKQIFGIADILDIIQTIRQGIQTVIQNVKELDSAMVEFRKVTDLPAQGYEDFMDSAAERSIDIGTSMTDYINSAADFARLGYEADEAQFMSEAANIFYNVSDEMDNISVSTDALIATMKAFDVEAENVYTVIDKINEVSNKTSISSGGLAEAITRGASAMSLAGNTIDETLALIVAGNETVRNPASVGAGLKTLSLRIRGAESDLEDMGEEVDEYVKSTSKMRDSILELTGVDIMENESTFKSTYQVLKEISEVQDELSDIDFANVMEQLFGKQRANIGASIIQNFDQAEKALAVSLDSTGSAAQEHAHWMESIEASENQAAAAMQNFSRTILESGAVKFYYDAKTGILGFLTQVVETLGTIPTLAAAAGAALNVMMSQQRGTGFQPTGQTSGGLGNMIQWVSGRNSGNSQLQKFLNAFNAQIASGATGVDAMSAAAIKTGVSLNDLSDSMKTTLTNANGVAVSMADLGVKASAASKKTSLMTTAMKGLSTVGNLVVGTLKGLAIGASIDLAFKGIEWVVGAVGDWVDSLVVTEEELQENVAAKSEEYEAAASALAEAESELNNINASIDELEGKETLTLIEQQQLEDLREAAELQGLIVENQRKAAAEKLQEEVEAQNELVEFTYGNSEFGESYREIYDTTVGNLENAGYNGFYNGENAYLANRLASLKNTSIAQMETGRSLAEILAVYDEMNNAVDTANNLLNDTESALSDQDKSNLSEAVELAEAQIAAIETHLNSTETQEELLNLLSYYDTLDTDILDSDIVEAADNARVLVFDSLRELMQRTDPSSWQKYAFDSIFASENMADFSDSLAEIAASGVITEEDVRSLLQTVSPELQQWMSDQLMEYGLIAEGTTTDEIANILTSEALSRFTPEVVQSRKQANLEAFQSSLFAGSEGYSTLTSAMQEQSEYGGISLETYQSLIALSPELANCLEMTASGYRLNTEAVYDFIEAQDAADYTRVLAEISALQDELANYDPGTAEYEAIQSEIDQWIILAQSIETATSEYQKWLNSQQTTDEDSMYENLVSGFETYQDNLDKGRTGVDDFQSFTDLLLGEDWQEQVGDGKLYESVQDAYESAEKMGKKWLAPGDDGALDIVQKWRDTLKGQGFLDENDNLIEGTTLEQIAEANDMTRDFAEALFMLSNAYGANFEFGFEVGDVEQQVANLEQAETQIAALDKVIADSETQLSTMESEGQSGTDAYRNLEAQIESYRQQRELWQQVIDSGGFLDPAELFKNYESGSEENPLTELQMQIDEINGKPVTITIAFDGETETLKGLLNLFGVNSGTLFVDGQEGPTVTGDTQLEGGRVVEGLVSDSPVTSDSSVSVDVNATDESVANMKEEVQGAFESDPVEAPVESTGEPSPSVPYTSSQESYSSAQTTTGEASVSVGATATPNAGEEFVGEVQDQVDSTEGVEVPTDTSTQNTLEVGGITVDDSSVKQIQEEVDGLVEQVNNLDLGDAQMGALSADAAALSDATSQFVSAYNTFQQTGSVETASAVMTSVQNLVAAYSTLQNNLNQLSPTVINADTSPALNAINALNGRTVTITVRANTSGASSAISGLGHASGTRSAPGGLSLVDEKGAELIEHTRTGTYELGTDRGARMTVLEPGDIVHTASETRNILQRAADFIGGFFRDGFNNKKPINGGAYAGGAFSTAVNTIKKKISDATKQFNSFKSSVASKVSTGSKSSKSTPIGGGFGGVSSGGGSSSSSSKGSSSGSSSKKSSGSSSKSSSSSSSNAEKWLEHANDMIDWIEIRLDRLERKTEDWKNQAEEAVGFLDKNVKLDSGLASVEQQLDETSQAYDRYMQHAATINDYFRSSGLTDDIIKKIQEGTIDIGPYDDEMQEMIREYQEWYEKALDCKDALYDLREEQRELATQKLDNILDQYDWQIERLDAIVDYSESLMDLKGASGIEIVESDYDDSITATQSKIMELQNERKTLVEEFNSLVADGLIQEGSEDWYNYTGEIEDLDQSIIDTKTDLEELKTAMTEIPLTNLRYALTALEATASQIQGMMDLHEAQGSRAESTDYQQLITNGMEQIANLEAQNVELRKQQEGLDVLSERYQELQDEINNNNEAILDMKISQEEWNDAVLDIKISELQDYADELSKINDNYQRQKDLQQAIEDLERAKTQRTQRVYREGKHVPLCAAMRIETDECIG